MDYFIWNLVFEEERKSLDPSTKVGAVLVDLNHQVLARGYNHAIRGLEEVVPWHVREGEKIKTKYPYIIHAEEDAIFKAYKENCHLENTILYTSLFPCDICAKLIVNAGIKKVYYSCDKYHDTPDAEISRKILSLAGVECTLVSQEELRISS